MDNWIFLFHALMAIVFGMLIWFAYTMRRLLQRDARSAYDWLAAYLFLQAASSWLTLGGIAPVTEARSDAGTACLVLAMFALLVFLAKIVAYLRSQ